MYLNSRWKYGNFTIYKFRSHLLTYLICYYYYRWILRFRQLPNFFTMHASPWRHHCKQLELKFYFVGHGLMKFCLCTTNNWKRLLWCISFWQLQSRIGGFHTFIAFIDLCIHGRYVCISLLDNAGQVNT